MEIEHLSTHKSQRPVLGSAAPQIQVDALSSTAVAIKRVCPWCKGKGRHGPAQDCGPCLGRGSVTYEHTTGESAMLHPSNIIGPLDTDDPEPPESEPMPPPGN